MTVLTAMWKHKAFVLPVLLLTLLAAGYVFQFGPRSYEANASFAMVNPRVPTETELLEHPELAALNSDNPYLRSSDPALISDVLITKLSEKSMAESLEESGLSPDYTVARSTNGNGFVIDISGVGPEPAIAVATTRALGDVLIGELRTIQTVNGADEAYLFTALPISSPDRAEEQFSSRLRSVIVVTLVGAVLMFGAVSLARALEAARTRRRDSTPQTTTEEKKRRKARSEETTGVRKSADLPATSGNRRASAQTGIAPRRTDSRQSPPDAHEGRFAFPDGLSAESGAGDDLAALDPDRLTRR